MIGKLLPAFLLCLCCGPYMLGATYYVDSIDGRDDNNGISAATPWKTLAKINSSKFLPADKILLRRGSVWREQLEFPSSGIDASPIAVDAYGEGELPVISGRILLRLARGLNAMPVDHRSGRRPSAVNPMWSFSMAHGEIKNLRAVTFQIQETGTGNPILFLFFPVPIPPRLFSIQGLRVECALRELT